VRTELRSNHPTESAMYKIVRSASAILAASKETRSVAYSVLRSNNSRELTDVSHWE
jgi:hypothetical protein